MREGEVLGLMWDCVDFSRGTITVKRQLRREQKKGGKYYLSTPKNGKARTIARPRRSWSCFKRIVAQIGTPSTRFHDLRHTFAVMSLQAGDDIKTVQNNLGHHTAAFTLDVYGHVTDQMKHESASRMQRYIEGIKQGNKRS